MKTRLFQNTLSALVAVLLPISALMCAGGGIDGSGFRSQGPISGFGSIVVNGTKFDTQRAAVVINGVQIGVGNDAVMSTLDIGRVVTVEGTRWSSADVVNADKVFYNNSIKGPVESIQEIDAATKQIVVMGQNVFVNTVTVFKNTSFDTIAPDDVLEVSGLFDDTGAIWANFIGKVGVFGPGTQVEVEGYITNLDTVMNRFEINDLVVDFSQADVDGLPAGAITEGFFVEVSGTLAAIGDPMQAIRIRPGDDTDAPDVSRIEVNGFVTDFISSAEFMVGNLMIQTDANTLFVDGTAAGVALGARLEAEGRLIAGVLKATEIEFWEPGQIEIEGLVTGITSANEFTVDTQVVRTDAETVFEGFDPSDIEPGIKLEIKGVPVDINRSAILADKVSLEK